MDRSEVLDTAKRYVTHDRQAEYGDSAKVLSRIARMWSEYLDYEIAPTEVAMMMALLKIARQRGNRAHSDNYVDMAGYAALAAELETVTEVAPVQPPAPRGEAPDRQQPPAQAPASPSWTPTPTNWASAGEWPIK